MYLHVILWSISSTFYVFLYKSKLSFSLDSLGFENFWRQNIGKNGAHKMLMKLKPEQEKILQMNTGT